MIVSEAHRLADAERVERTEDRCVAKALGYAACVERVELVVLKMQMGGGHGMVVTKKREREGAPESYSPFRDQAGG